MADIMRGIVDGVDMGKTDHADNKKTKHHRKDGLTNHRKVLGDNRQMSGVGLLHGGSSDRNKSSRCEALLRPLFLHLPDYVTTGEMKVHSTQNVLSNDFGACRRSESAFVSAIKCFAIFRCRTKPQQRAEGAAMHHREAPVAVRLENQSVNVVAPDRWLFTVIQTTCPRSSARNGYFTGSTVNRSGKPITALL